MASSPSLMPTGIDGPEAEGEKMKKLEADSMIPHDARPTLPMSYAEAAGPKLRQR